MSWLAALVALVAAISFGWSTALMHHGASGADEGLGSIALLRHVFGQWRWLIGLVASLLGLALHAVALGLGSLTLVQPIVMTGLFFSLVFRDALDRQVPDAHTLVWGAVTAAGLGLFLAATGSQGSTDVPDGAGAVTVIGLGLLASAAAYWAAARNPQRTGLLLGISAGIVFGLVAGALKATTSALSHHDLFGSWPLYTMILLGLTGFTLNQHAYHQSRLTDYLPMLNMANLLVALTFGVVVFGERPHGDPLALLLEGLGLAGVLAGIYFLASTEPQLADAESSAESNR